MRTSYEPPGSGNEQIGKHQQHGGAPLRADPPDSYAVLAGEFAPSSISVRRHLPDTLGREQLAPGESR